jgi:hypothetical protein
MKGHILPIMLAAVSISGRTAAKAIIIAFVAFKTTPVVVRISR